MLGVLTVLPVLTVLGVVTVLEVLKVLRVLNGARVQTPILRLAATCIGLLGIALAGQLGAQSGTAAIGLVRSDGVLFPLGILRPDGLVSLTLEMQNDEVVPLTPEGRSLARSGWVAFPFSGRPSFPLKVEGVVKADAHCITAEGFKTDAPILPYEADSFPRPHAALAVFGEGDATRGERLQPPYDPMTLPVTARIVALTQATERRRIRESPERFKDLSVADRARSPVRITTLVRDTSSGVTRYFFDACKRCRSAYPLYMTGWLVQHEDGFEPIDVRDAMPDDGAGKAEGTRALMGLAHLGGRTVWVLANYGYEWESYELFEFFANGAHSTSADAGGC